MDTREQRIGPAVILELDGRLTVEADTRRLQELVGHAVRRRISHIVLDFKKVRQIDCSGIGQLVQLRNEACMWGATLVLTNVGRRVRRLLDLAGLFLAFPVFDSRHDALIWCTGAAVQARALSLGPDEARNQGRGLAGMLMHVG